ncbi:hypothetical protein AT239_02615 [Bartonella henselae]|nr:hypothetical protein AT239_02615 [Bartonella henselae]OLL55773.1 hypothetical protein AT240_00310 [Bartonella henselae]
MQYLCYGTKCSKQQEILLIFHTKKYKKIINRLKMENFRQKNAQNDPIWSNFISKVINRIYDHHHFNNNFSSKSCVRKKFKLYKLPYYGEQNT